MVHAAVVDDVVDGRLGGRAFVRRAAREALVSAAARFEAGTVSGKKKHGARSSAEHAAAVSSSSLTAIHEDAEAPPVRRGAVAVVVGHLGGDESGRAAKRVQARAVRLDPVGQAEVGEHWPSSGGVGETSGLREVGLERETLSRQPLYR